MSEQGHVPLRSGVYTYLVPLLNGQHMVDEIINRLQDEFPASEIFSALMRLRSRGYLVDEPLSLPLEQAAFWDMFDGGAEKAARRLQEVPVSVISCGDIDPLPFRTILTSLGVLSRGQWGILGRSHQGLPATQIWRHSTDKLSPVTARGC